jgi:hypothetical protein
MKRTLALLGLLLIAACGNDTGTVVAVPTQSATVAPRPTPPVAGPHFGTPEAAMTYLATAWNAGNLTDLKHVTDPSARLQLLSMHSEATNLRLNHCTLNKARGDYSCVFDHDYPAGYKTTKAHGEAQFTVGPATRPGWYMTYFESCG